MSSLVVSKIGLINIGGQLLGQVTRDRRKCGGLEAVDGAAGAQFGSFSGGDLDGGLSGVGGEGGRHVVEGGALEALVACGDVAVLGDEEHRGSRHEVVASHQFETIVEEDGKLDAGAFDESTSVLGGVEGDRPELAADLGVLHVDAVPVEIADLAGLAIECEEGEEEGAGLEAVGEGATTALDVCQVEIGSLCPGGQHSFSSYLPELAKVYTLADHYIRTREHAMRTKLVEEDLIECVFGLGPNLFYNSPMEACVLVCRSQKTKDRKGKILFINAVNEVARESAQSFLKPEHQAKILTAYQDFSDQPGFAYVAKTDEVLAKDGDLSIPKYVEKVKSSTEGSLDLPATWANFESDGRAFWMEMDSLVEMLDGVVAEEANDA